MSRPTLQIVQPGMLTTVQDRGRYGYQRFGMPTAGAMDSFALRAGNALLGNEDNAAGLEVTVLGPRINFLVDTRIAVTGANASPRLDGEPIQMWEAVSVREGSRLDFRSPKDGMRAYLAVAGGIDVPLIMGSRATYLRAAIGGVEGRSLRAGDVLNTFGENQEAFIPEGRFPLDSIPQYGDHHELRVVLGPQHSAFTSAGLDTFLGATYTVSIHSDRMGYRLEGAPIEHADGADIISDGIALGAIQVPGNGQPIILLADRGTTGGYTKIATVISTDLSKVAQAMPGHNVTFSSVSLEEAQDSYRSQEALLSSVREAPPVAARLAVALGDKLSDILGEDGEPLSLPADNEAFPYARTGTVRIDGSLLELEIVARRKDERP